MKKIIMILAVISLAACKKENVSANRQGEGVVWRISQAGVLYDKGGTLKFEGGNEYQLTSLNNWFKVGTYSFENDSVFTHTSNPGVTYSALYEFSSDGNTLIFRYINYKSAYPHGGEPQDILVKQ